MFKLVFVFPSTGKYQGESPQRWATEAEVVAYARSVGYENYDVRPVLIEEDGEEVE